MEEERGDFPARVRVEFLRIADAEPKRFLVLDAALPVAELASRIRLRVSDLLATL